jgi:alkylhydroperoxidase family enzyme
MAWINMVPEDEADGELQALYKKHGHAPDGIDHILKIHSLNPKSMQLHYDYYKHLMAARLGLSRTQREMIAVTVSTANNCHY